MVAAVADAVADFAEAYPVVVMVVAFWSIHFPIPTKQSSDFIYV